MISLVGMSTRMWFKLCCLMLLTSLGAQAAPDKPIYYCDKGEGIYEANSTYRANLNQAFSRLLQSAEHDLDGNYYGFYNLSHGENAEKVYAAGLCRGDAEPDTCWHCLDNSARLLTQVCTIEKEVLGGFDQCVLCYSDRSFLGLAGTRPIVPFWSNQTVSSNYTDRFFENLGTLLKDLRNQASTGGSLRKYATGNISGGHGFQTIYALAQCTPDLSQIDCNNCLDQAFLDIPRYYGRLGGRVVTPSCNFRYETYLFYGPVYYAPPAALPSPTPPRFTNTTATQAYRKKSNTFGTGAVVTTAASVVLIVSVGVYSRVRKRNISAENGASPEAVEEIECMERMRYALRTIKAATNNFSERNKIGRSTVGAVYRGRLRNGKEIAVKSYRNHGQHHDYFEKDVLCTATIHHRNIVPLLGFCSKKDEKYLVYEYQAMSLDRLLFDTIGRKYLNWDMRYKILKGIANALLYLHEGSAIRIIHSDIQASKVFLDKNLNPKISLGGSSKYFGVNQIGRSTSRVVGTVGYLDPEYALSGEITVKSDVFSFGVLLLEIVSGQRSGSFWQEHAETFINYVRRNWREGANSNLVDPQIRNGDSVPAEIIRCIQIGLHCVELRSHARPTMASVVYLLDNWCNTHSDLPVISESENHRHQEIIVEADRSSSFDSAELPDHSSDSFVSATETSLSPMFEIGFGENETVGLDERDFVQSRSRFLARMRYIHFRAISYLRSWRPFCELPQSTCAPI